MKQKPKVTANNFQKPIAISLFFISGMVALIFQVVWLKELVLIFGNTIWAVSTLLTAFMAGLAFGSWFFGKKAAKFNFPLKVYGILEGIIGIFGLITIWAFHYLPYLYIPLYSLSNENPILMGFFKFLLAFLILIIPTTCMGGTLPLLAHQFGTKEGETDSGNIGVLYSMNTFGAVAGVLLTAFYLIPLLGLKKTIILGAILNGIIMIVVWVITIHSSKKIKLNALSSDWPVQDGKFPDKKWVLWIYLLAGFSALGYEVIWNRILVLHTGSSVYAYSIMLAIYLLGLALGAAIMSHWSQKIKNPLKILSIIQLLIAFDLILLIFQFEHLSSTLVSLAKLMGVENYFSFVVILFIAIFQILIIPTFLFGATFPLVVRIYVNDKKHIGKQTGLLYSYNTVGNILGSFCTGFILVPYLGAQLGLLVLASINLWAGIIILYKYSQVFWKKTVVAFILAAVFFSGYFGLTKKNQVILSAGIFQSSSEEKVKLLFFKEDIYATVTIEEIETPVNKFRRVCLNGVNVAGDSPDLFTIQKMQGHLPLLLHANPKSVLHIGFGSGGTAWSVSRHPVETIKIAEISRSIIDETSTYFQDINHNVLSDPRVQVSIMDGRNYILAKDETFDVILSDSIHPRFSGNGSLYTYEYYQLLKKRLNPGGVVSQWLPFYTLTPENFQMIIKSFQQVFPYTYVWFVNNTINDFVIVTGQLTTPDIDFKNIENRLQIPQVKADLKEILCDNPFKILDFYLFSNEQVVQFVGDVSLHTDDNMAIEYLSGRILDRQTSSMENFTRLFHARSSIVNRLQHIHQSALTDVEIIETMNRYEKATSLNLQGQLLLRTKQNKRAMELFESIRFINPDDLEPVEYFGAPYQKPILKIR
jgi:spermidine synthase